MKAPKSLQIAHPTGELKIREKRAVERVVDSYGGAVQVSWDPDAEVTAFGQLVFFVEFLKEPQGNEVISLFGLNTGQTLSIPFILAGIIIMVYSKKNLEKQIN